MLLEHVQELFPVKAKDVVVDHDVVLIDVLFPFSISWAVIS